MKMLDKMADVFLSPAQAIWSIFAAGGSFFLFFIMLQTNLPLAVFYGFLGVLTIAGMVMLPTTFKDAAESSVDWNEQVDWRETIYKVILGLGGLAATSFLIGFLSGGNILRGATSLLWVPKNLIPLQTFNLSFQLTTDIFATVFAVVPGEESLKILWTPMYKAYEHTDLANWPFALQPCILFGVGFWSAMHLVLNQQPWPFFFTAFLAGEIMMYLSAQTGSYLTSWLIHAGWNGVILFLSHIFMGI